jgi:L-alanine-DL-glutamate epimerase-like enolase superfamily enzyme
MKITDVEAIVLDIGKNYPDPSEAAVPDGPGLGVEVDAAVVERYRVA